MRTFYHLLGNTLVAAIVNYTVWFAITFYVYLETQSVFATGMISGIYLTLIASSGFWFGSLVDHYKKKHVLLVSTTLSLLLYICAFILYISVPEGTFTNVASPFLWLLILLIIAGTTIGNIRGITMPTLVTLLVPEDRRDKANGLNGMVMGLSFGTVSVISGLLVGHSGMYWVLIFAIVLSLAALAHLWCIQVPEAHPVGRGEGPRKIDIRGTLEVISKIPGLVPLILFTTFNNFLGGVFMALMDAYGLSLVRVEAWGLILGALSFSFLLGGALIARFGLGKNPLRTMLIANTIIWISCMFFTIQPWLWLLIAGMFVYMSVFPFIEAAEQTVLQKVVPVERQGRVFGFAQSVEQLASPLTAFLMGPLAQFFFIPFMTTGLGAELIGSWFGTGQGRGIALVFTLTGIVGLLATIAALNSRPYRALSRKYLEG